MIVKFQIATPDRLHQRTQNCSAAGLGHWSRSSPSLIRVGCVLYMHLLANLEVLKAGGRDGLMQHTHRIRICIQYGFTAESIQGQVIQERATICQGAY